MVFASPIFLLAFLPLALAIYHAVPRQVRNLVLLVLSVVFYAWGEHKWLVVMLVSIAFNWLGALAIDHAQGHRGARWLVVAVVTANLAALAYFKYGTFVVHNVNALLSGMGTQTLEPPDIHLPLGISFFTFHALSYVIDVYRGQSRALASPLETALYFLLFPQLIAGPIIRYHYIEAQLHLRSRSVQDVALGAQRFVYGLAKKVLIANTAARCADGVFDLTPEQLGFGNAWVGVVAYAVQIYFDFSGYSDMAIGLGRMFGFRFPENFDRPYTARSITEFWRRWHISLSSWFRDYLYIPLGGNRVSTARRYANLVTVFLLCGLWHGPSWNFVIWGGLHGLFLVLERSPLGRFQERLPRALQHAYVLLVVCIGWVFFRAADLTSAANVLVAMSGAAGASPGSHPVRLFVTPAVAVAGLFAFAVVVLQERGARKDTPDAGHSVSDRGLLATPIMFVLLTLCLADLAANTYNPFIYFRF